jgi:hypothetical protein
MKHIRNNDSRLRTLSSTSRAKEAGYEVEKLRSKDRHSLVTAKLRDRTHKVDTADAILAVMPDVIEDYEWSI